jgi:fibronectin-binding autotransporter adhesin
VLGRHSGGVGNGGGTLTFGAGVVEAQTINLAVTDFRGGASTNDANTIGVIAQNGGTMRFGDLSKGSGNASYNWSAGTLANATSSNAINQNVSINLLTTEPHLVDVDAGRSMVFQSGAGFSGAGNLYKVGSGSLQLEGPSINSGLVSIEEGLVLANNATGSALGTGAITVSVSGTLGGTGSVSGAVTVDLGGTLAPGASIESLSTGAVTMNAGSVFALEISTSGTPSSDLLAVNGAFTLDLTSSPELTIADLGANVLLAEGTILPFVTYTAGWNGGLFAIGGNSIADDVESFAIGANIFTIDYNRNNDTVALVAVPEPATGVILLGGIASIVAGRRRRAARGA